MNKIFIKYDKNNVVTYTHYKPFDSLYGLGKTEEELLKEGALVVEYNEPNYIEGKSAVAKYDKDNNNVYFEYVDAPQVEKTEKEDMESLKNEISNLRSENEHLRKELTLTQNTVNEILLMTTGRGGSMK